MASSSQLHIVASMLNERWQDANATVTATTAIGAESTIGLGSWRRHKHKQVIATMSARSVRVAAMMTSKQSTTCREAETQPSGAKRQASRSHPITVSSGPPPVGPDAPSAKGLSCLPRRLWTLFFCPRRPRSGPYTAIACTPAATGQTPINTGHAKQRHSQIVVTTKSSK